MSHRFGDSLWAGSGWNWFHPDPSSGVFHCKHGNGICHTGLLTACEQGPDGTGSILIHHQEFFTVHTAMVCHTGLLTACGQDPDGTRSILIHHQEFFTVNMTMVYVTQVCWQLVGRIISRIIKLVIVYKVMIVYVLGTRKASVPCLCLWLWFSISFAVPK